MTYFKKKKNFTLTEGPFFKFEDTKTKPGRNPPPKKRSMPRNLFPL